MEISSGYPDGIVRTNPLRKFLIELFSKQNAMQANPLNQRRVGAEPIAIGETPTGEQLLVHYRRTLSKCCFGITNTHAPLYSIIATSAPPSVGVSKANAFSAPTLHGLWVVVCIAFYVFSPQTIVQKATQPKNATPQIPPYTVCGGRPTVVLLERLRTPVPANL